MEGEKGRVCVTGAGGFIGSWVVKLLLSEGHTVHGTVRDPGTLSSQLSARANGSLDKLYLSSVKLVQTFFYIDVPLLTGTILDLRMICIIGL